MAFRLNKKLILILVLFVATILRFYKIDSLPALNPDEAALGYNAYSLLQTGKDEHGVSFPLHFKSFGDYKPGGYVYLDMPFVALFGLNEIAVRLPNLIFSILTIYLVYRLILLLTLDLKLSTLAAFVLAVNPWHIHFSRGAWESGTALFFLLLGLYWFYSFIINHKSYYLYLFPLPLVAALYTYHSARLIIPVLFLILFLTNYRLLITVYQRLFFSLLIAAILSIPVFFSFLKNGGTARFGGVGLTADYGPISRAEELLNEHGNTKLINRVIHNKRLLYLISFGEKYFSHFDYNFLFLKGDEVPRSKSPDLGQFYLFELPLLFIGIFFLLRSNNYHLRSLLLSLILVSPLASALTFQAPSALRALPLVIPLSILISFGLYSLRKIFLLMYIFGLVLFFQSYFIRSPVEYAFAWNRGFKEIIPVVNQAKDSYQNIFFTNEYDQPYILYLFYSQYPPLEIQPQIRLTPPDQFGFSTVEKIDNITFFIPQEIPTKSLIIESSDYKFSRQSFTIYTK